MSLEDLIHLNGHSSILVKLEVNLGWIIKDLVNHLPILSDIPSQSVELTHVVFGELTLAVNKSVLFFNFYELHQEVSLLFSLF